MAKDKNNLLYVNLEVLFLFGLVYLYLTGMNTGIVQETDNGERSGQANVQKNNVDQNFLFENQAIIAENLSIPWEIAFLPDGRILVTERSGNLVLIGEDVQKFLVPNVEHLGEGGLLGMALHPDFENNRWIYIYKTSRVNEQIQNIVERFEFNDELTNSTIILDGIPASQNHNGGRMAFGPDGQLYITTGDAQNSMLAQDLNSLAGKILRIQDNGNISEGNPWQNEVWSYGHRNPQGLAWDGQGRLWSTEHGRSGILSGYDELNLIVKGGNYGWPLIQGDEQEEDMIAPVMQSGALETWAPAGLAYLDNTLYFAGLRSQSIYSVQIASSGAVDHLAVSPRNKGRLRAVKIGPDGFIYITTSNHDGRSEPQQGDDKIIRINPRALTQDLSD